MAGSDCCNLVGNLDLGLTGCIISVNTSSATEIITACGDDPLEGPTIDTLSISAYADVGVWVGCPSRAGLNIPFVRKYDCINDVVYFIFSGRGQSFFTGEADKHVTLFKVLPTKSEALSASSGGGPSSLYMKSKQTNGYGMSYDGGPINFDTDPEGTTIALGGIFNKTYYLQSFNFEAQSGQIPVVSYSLVSYTSAED